MTKRTTPSDGLRAILATAAFVTTTLIAAPTFAQTATDAAHATIVEVTEITRDLEQPWGLTFLPDGTALVTSRDTGDIRRVDPETGQHVSVGLVSDVDAWKDSGRLGVAASPTFADDRLVYAYLSTETDNRVIALQFSEDLTSFEQMGVVLDGIERGGGHQGGRLIFDADGYLWITTGDANNLDLSPDPNSLNGKILRIRPDGTIPEGNPFGTPVYSTGHRNPQGITFWPRWQRLRIRVWRVCPG